MSILCSNLFLVPPRAKYFSQKLVETKIELEALNIGRQFVQTHDSK